MRRPFEAITVGFQYLLHVPASPRAVALKILEQHQRQGLHVPRAVQVEAAGFVRMESQKFVELLTPCRHYFCERGVAAIGW